MKGKTHDLKHDLTFSAHTISIRSMFRVLGIHNFGKRMSGKECKNKPNGFCGKGGRCVTIQETTCYPRNLMEIMYPNRKFGIEDCQSCGCRYNVQKCCCTKNYQASQLECHD